MQCDRKITNHTWALCNAHYLQKRRGEEYRPARRSKKRFGETPCEFPDCKNYSVQRGLCYAHAWQRKTGRPLVALYGTQVERHWYTQRDAEGRKRCIRCREWLPESSFGASAKAGDGLRTECRLCRSKDRAAITQKIHAQRVSSSFGVPLEWYANTLAEQKGACAICKRAVGPTTRRMAVDHDHSCCPTLPACGKCVRGILCTPCNLSLGALQESPETVRSMLNYLEKWCN